MRATGQSGEGEADAVPSSADPAEPAGRLQIDADAIVTAFALGHVHRLRPLGGRSTDRVWALDTSRGRWVVKTRLVARESSVRGRQIAAMRAAGRLECAALAAGVSLPRPVSPMEQAVGYWTLHQGDIYVRVTERLAGQPPVLPADQALAAWVGRTLATIERIGLTTNAPVREVYTILPEAAWAGWLDRCRRRGLLSTARCRTLLGAVVEAGALVRASVAALSAPRLIWVHRDMNWQNILLTSTGPVLLDFDHAGPDVAWWELVHQVWQVACRQLGQDEPATAAVVSALTGYVDAGGNPGAADATAFTAVLRSTLHWVAYNLWTALDVHHGPGVAVPDTVYHEIHKAGDRLSAIVRSLDRWAMLLR